MVYIILYYLNLKKYVNNNFIYTVRYLQNFISI